MGRKNKDAQKDLPADSPSKGAAKAVRSADTFLRVGVASQLDLSKAADTKAQVMLTICAAIATYSLGRSYLGNERYPALVLVFFSLIAALLAVASMKPPTPRRKPPRPGEPGFNALTFTHFAGLTPQEYRAAMREILADPAQMHQHVTDAMYAYGAIYLRRQYYYLDLCYKVFLAGMLLSAGGWVWVMYG